MEGTVHNLVDIFKQHKVTSQQMDTYLSLIKAPKLKIIKRIQYIEKNLESSFTKSTFKLFFPKYFFAVLNNGP